MTETGPSSPLPRPPAPGAPWARPELLAPAGDWDCVHAAVENGADAVYFGLDRFNARMRAKNFTMDDLPALMAFLHLRGVRGYVTFNTLVFTGEIAGAADFLRGIIAAGADAAIIQDAGIMRLIRALSPDFPIHASTQMTVTTAAGVEFARSLGASLVVLARENSVPDILAIQKALCSETDASGSMQSKDEARGSGAESPPKPPSAPLLEVFIHGALCVAYSGQCLTSEALGGRSANRGECAQACRMPFELVANERTVDLGGRRHLLSPQDLAGVSVLPDLVRAGVASLKIEGRLKSPEYVASITRIYREALDRVMAAAAGGGPPEAAMDAAAQDAAASARYEMEMAFSRGLFTGWFRGTDNQALVHGRFGTKRGVLLGRVSSAGGDHVVVRLEAPLKPGDGVVFDAGNPEEDEEGGRVYEIDGPPEAAVLRFGRGDIDFSRIRAGDQLWKTSDPALQRRLRQTWEGGAPRFQRPVSAEVRGAAGAPLTLLLRDGEGRCARVDSAMPLSPAERRPLTEAVLREQLGRLGGTPFRLGALDGRLEPGLILPLGELNRMRREAVRLLGELRSRPPRWTLNAGITPDAWQGATPPDRTPLPGVELIAGVRTHAQLEAAAAAAGVAAVYCEFENPKHYRDSAAWFRAWRAADPSRSRRTLWVAPPRVAKPGEEWILRQVRSAGADGILVRNYDDLRFFADCRRRGDHSLNVANPWAAGHFIRGCGLERVTASYDLNAAQLAALLAEAPPAWFDLTLHQHMPMFHMEHCLFCAFLCGGHDYHDCGRPCDTTDLRLRDRAGLEHPVKADAGCRNTVYNARAQTGAEFADRFLAAGARSFRIDFVDEGPEEAAALLDRYRRLLDGGVSGAALWREFKLINQMGVTRGSLESSGRQCGVP